MNRDDDFFQLPRPKRSRAPAEEPSPRGEAPAPTAAEAAATAPPSGPARLPPSIPPPSSTRGKRRAWLWPLAGVGVVALVIAGGAFGYWAFWNIAARMRLTMQPLTIRLPEEASITLHAHNVLDVGMRGVIHAQVPLVQTLELPVNGTYDTIIDLDTKVPLETVITYEGILPIDTLADIEAKAPVNFQNVKKYKNLRFKAKLPMKMRLPVKLVVPVKQDIPLRYKGPLRVTINHVIRAPVGTTLDTALKVDQTFRVPVLSEVPMRMQLPQVPVRATITDADLDLDLATARLQRKPGEPPPAE